MLVAQCTLAHVGQLDRALGTCVHEPIAADRMEFRSRDDLCKLFHVGRLDINNVEALVLDVEVPEVDSQIVATNECLSIAVDRYAVDVVGVCVRIRLSWYCSNNCVVVCEPWKLQVGGAAELCVRVPDGTASTSNPTSRCQLMRQVVLRHHF